MARSHPLDALFRSDAAEDRGPPLDLDVEAVVLRDAYTALRAQHRFTPGMLVRQKPGCRRYHNFSANGIAVVWEMVEPQLSAIEGDPLPVDMTILERTKDGAVQVFRVASMFFEPLPETDLAAVTNLHNPPVASLEEVP